ncbi:MAG: hypothetical protein ABIV39_10660, partial [Verrucomicrobiota bacterium]
MRAFFLVLLAGAFFQNSLSAQNLNAPARGLSARPGTEVAVAIQALSLESREDLLFSEAMGGNIPSFLRKLSPVTVTNISHGKTNRGTLFVIPDYFAVGSDEDYFLTPMTPFTAQKLADAFDCTLPTRKMVDAIYSNAVVKLAPSFIPPTPAMTTVSIFKEHNESIRQQRAEMLTTFPLGALTAGHKKDVVISSRFAFSPGKVAIYGWHQTNSRPIQPLYLGHAASWVDYSHGIRLVQKQMRVNGVSKTVAEVLSDPETAALLSDEGPLQSPKYHFETFPKAFPAPSLPRVSTNIVAGQFQISASFNEQTMQLLLDHGVRVLINAPSAEEMTPSKKMCLVFYGLPNGNSIEQTIGKKMNTNDDWHFNIQHIGAQTRFLRARLTNETIVVVYLENSLKSWP